MGVFIEGYIILKLFRPVKTNILLDSWNGEERIVMDIVN